MKRFFKLQVYRKVTDKPSAAARQAKHRLKKKGFKLQPGCCQTMNLNGIQVLVTNTGSGDVWLTS